MPRVTVDPLNWQVPIVDQLGRPTQEFMRKFNAQRDTRSADADDIAAARAAATAAQTAATAAQAAAAAAQATANNKPDTFLELEDTPDLYTGKAGKVPKVKTSEDGLEFGDAGGTFLSLTDTPDSYTGQAGKIPRVNDAEDALEFVAEQAGEGWELAASWTHSGNVPNVDFTNLGSYTELMVIIRGVTTSASGFLGLRFSVDNGSTFFDTSGDYKHVSVNGVLTDNLIVSLQAAASSTARSFMARIYPSSINGVDKAVVSRWGSSDELTLFTGSQSPIDAIRVIQVVNAGDLTAGSIYVFGLRPRGPEADIAAQINDAASKATPVDADELALVDSAAANVLKKLTWANLKATLKAYFDPLYVDVAGDTMTGNLMVDLSDSVRSQLGGSGATFTRAIDSIAGPVNTYNKARGALSAQTAAQQNDVMVRLLFQGYDGAAYQPGAEIRTTIIEPTPSATAMGSEIEFRIAPLGSATPSAGAFVFDIANGFQMGGSIVVDGSRHFAPRSYTIAGLPAATTTGRLIWCSNLGGGAGLLEADGTNWKRVRCDGYQEVSGTGNFNLTWLSSAPIVAHTAVLTANRNCTLLTTNAYAGARYRISRHGSDAFALNIVDNPSGVTIKPLSSGDWVEVTYNGTNWYVSAFGSL